MATINVSGATSRGAQVFEYKWETMGNADTGTSIETNNLVDMTVTIDGTFGSATVTIQGSNDGTNWHSMTDPQGNAVAKTAAAMEVLSEAPRYIRAITSGGTGTDVDVILLARRALR